LHPYLGIYALLGATSFLLSVVLTRLLIGFAPRLGLVDEPGTSKFHRAVMPVGGGLAMYAALLPVLLVPEAQSARTLIVVLAAGLVAAIGLIDDLRHVAAIVKFAALVGLTGLLFLAGIGASTTRVSGLDFLITVLWVTGVSSAFNAIDNMDGLATGVAAIAALSFLVIACQTGQWVLGALSAALVGSSLGFLAFNFPSARIFMGDTGSFFLGFLLAILGVVGEWNSNEIIAAVIPILVLGVPIFDLAFTVLRRHLTGVTRSPLEAIRHCGTDHLSHRLVRLGLTPRGAVLLLYLIAASFGISAVTLRNAGSADGILHLLQALVITAALIPIFRLGEAPRPAGDEASANGEPREDPAARHAAGWMLLLPLVLEVAQPGAM
jgi:UDP-GlcNAc:undecaprenyl-phosphate GlcNAc-1-phosphate transferase